MNRKDSSIKDSRVNAKSITLGNYFIIFLVILFFCGSYAGLYFLQVKESPTIYVILSMLTYLVIISLVVCALFALFRQRMVMRPVRQLCQAAQKVAAGDFSVRLSPARKDGKKDEFEVLFEDFNTMVAELASTEMLKNDFVSNVSHEIKTPLAVIQNYATILQSEQLTDAERKEYSARIKEASEELNILITNILQLSRLENQKICPALRPFNLSEALSRSILDFDSPLEDKSIDLQVDLDDTLVITSDANLLDCVWRNLLSNAIKFTQPDGRITVLLARQNDLAVVSVQDTGCGISEDAQKHIFDKFYQEDSSHTTQGNGLGLALVKQIVTLLNGTITIQSVLNQGSCFTVKLPVGNFNQKVLPLHKS